MRRIEEQRLAFRVVTPFGRSCGEQMGLGDGEKVVSGMWHGNSIVVRRGVIGKGLRAGTR